MSDFFTTIETPIVTVEQPLGLFINNEFVKGARGQMFSTVNPTTENTIAAVHEATEEDVDVAVTAARAAFSTWRKVPASSRSRLLYKLADLMERDRQMLGAIESLNNGKSISMVQIDLDHSIGCIRYYAGWADKIYGQTIDTIPDHLVYTRHEPIGVCVEIIPWNFPIMMFTWKIGPAIAAGNTVVLKTAEQTPLSALYVAKLIKEAGFPAGAINILSGFGHTARAAIASHIDIDKVAFTGSTTVGRTILLAAANSNLNINTCGELGL
ncbi:Aldehyde/histidinol dehydrogenase [Aspergillus insuetus]